MIRTRLLCAVLAAAACGSAAATDSSPTPPPPPPPPPAPVSGILVNTGDLIVFVGEQIQLTAALADSNGMPLTNRAVTWSSVGSGATITPDGVLSGVVPGGTTMITATSEGHSASAQYTTAYGAALSDTGGTVTYPGHATIQFGPSSLSGPTRVSLLLQPDPIAATFNPHNVAFIPGTFVSVHTYGGSINEFFQNVSVTLSYNPGSIPAGLAASRLLITFDEASPGFSEGAYTAIGGTVDSIAHTITLRPLLANTTKLGIGH